MTDYLNRGETLSEYCLYEYCSKVYKTTMTAEEKKKALKIGKHAKGRRPNERHRFSDNHPQSETDRN